MILYLPGGKSVCSHSPRALFTEKVEFLVTFVRIAHVKARRLIWWDVLGETLDWLVCPMYFNRILEEWDGPVSPRTGLSMDFGQPGPAFLCCNSAMVYKHDVHEHSVDASHGEIRGNVVGRLSIEIQFQSGSRSTVL